MTTRRIITAITAASLMSIAGCEQETAAPTPVVVPDATPVVATDQTPAPDNTSNNTGDVASEAKTPLDQSEAAAHIKITADIRRAIMEDKAMSMNAQNCKIITEASGMVTLRGVVDTQAEKNSIEAKAQAVAGAAMVTNELEVKAS